jgi:hypothetical protein
MFAMLAHQYCISCKPHLHGAHCCSVARDMLLPMGLVTVIVPTVVYTPVLTCANCIYTVPAAAHLIATSTRDAVVNSSLPCGSALGVLRITHSE